MGAFLLWEAGLSRSAHDLERGQQQMGESQAPQMKRRYRYGRHFNAHLIATWHH